MGSHSFNYTFDGTETALKRDFAAQQAHSLHEDGHAYDSGGIGAVDYLHIESKRVFSSLQEAEDYVLERTNKNEAIAVRFKQQTMPFADTKTGIRLFEAAQKASLMLSVEPTDVLKRVKAGTSTTRRCNTCKSSIAIARLRSLDCPVCRAVRFCVSASANARRHKLHERAEAAEASFAAAEAAYNKAAPGSEKWFVGGWLAT